MGIVLFRNGRDFGVELPSWHLALELARDYGWRFAGTLHPVGGKITDCPARRVGEPAQADGADGVRIVCGGRLWIDWSRERTPGDWDGNYLIPAGQRVSAEDAWAFADALDLALPAIPDEDVRGLEPGGRPAPVDMRHWFRSASPGSHPEPPEALDALAWFSGARKQQIRDLIAFCRAGGFSIG